MLCTTLFFSLWFSAVVNGKKKKQPQLLNLGTPRLWQPALLRRAGCFGAGVPPPGTPLGWAAPPRASPPTDGPRLRARRPLAAGAARRGGARAPRSPRAGGGGLLF